MNEQPVDHKRERIEAIRARALAGLSPEDAALVGPFVEHYYAGVDFEDVAGAAIENLSGAALSILTFARARRPGQAAIRLFNPAQGSHGFESPHTVVEIVNDDMPFLVDSIAGAFSLKGTGVHLVVHPTYTARRDPDGRLLAIAPAGAPVEGGTRESLMHLEIDQQEASELPRIEARLAEVLTDVRAAVGDWRMMLGKLDEAVSRLNARIWSDPNGEVREAIDFLSWARTHHFTFLGYREYSLTEDGDTLLTRPIPETGLGVLAPNALRTKDHERALPKAAREFFHGPAVVAISKSSRRANVHRHVPMDLISVKNFDDAGRLVGERRFVGLFTSMVYNIAATETPLIRRKVDWAIRKAGFTPASYDAKAFQDVLELFPRDELFQISREALLTSSLRILKLQLRPRLALIVRPDGTGRFVSCLLLVPRDSLTASLRDTVQEILKRRFDSEDIAFEIPMSDRPLVQVHFIVRLKNGHLPEYSEREIEAELADAARSWTDRFRDAAVSARGEQAGLAVYRRFAHAFPAAYQETTPVEAALADAREVEEALASSKLGMRLYRLSGEPATHFHIKTFEPGPARTLAKYLRILERMGLRVLGEIPVEVTLAETGTVSIRDFDVTNRSEVDLDAVGPIFREAFSLVWNEAIENDDFNRLVLGAGLTGRQVVILRAIFKYLRQTGFAYSQKSVELTLGQNPAVVRRLIDLFQAQFDPAYPGDREARVSELAKEISGLLEKVTGDEDFGVLNSYFQILQATLRTNFFRKNDAGEDRPYVSFKLESAKVPKLPEPRPLFEVFVYSPRVEGIHLRGGKVARGGIRWSDRPDDFRTEILGLFKAQMVKNAVIVPVGAKGGFVLKRAATVTDRQQEGIDCYHTFIRGLLDITDNLEGTRVVPPKDVVRRDPDDPYLVVAADKGTATFSDFANALSREYSFWLGDAFASGGSAGYDHKKMAITARGAWESVKRHFRLLSRDPDREEFTATGVGDMSGDVFGNGMLRSDKLRLFGAFDHRHIFVDPNPDPSRSFAERLRLFNLPRSSWNDYDRAALSQGGAIYERQARTIAVSPEVQARFGLADAVVEPPALMQAILLADVDLLYFGGIGTFVKASHETHADASDRTNDNVRVDANRLRCKVIGEGANLGLTQASRVEYALKGGALNTEFIDNSGGVDCSDHEVNIKIAMTGAIAANMITMQERDALLVQMTDDVAERVLADNYAQAWAITQLAAQGPALVDEQIRLMNVLEKEIKLDRTIQGLPSNATLRKRGTGLTRPELSVLLSNTKIHVFNQILASDLPDEPELVEDLIGYFPTAMQQRFRPVLETHRLRREIIATEITNGLVNRVGPSFVSRLSDETGRTVSEIARATLVARQVFDAPSLWTAIERLDGRIDANLQISLAREVTQLVGQATRWFLAHGGRERGVQARAALYRSEIAILSENLDALLPEAASAARKQEAERLASLGVPVELANRVPSLPHLTAGCDIVDSAREAQKPVDQIGRLYFALGDVGGFSRLRRAASAVRATSPAQQVAVDGILEDLSHDQAALTRAILTSPSPDLEAWVANNREGVARVDRRLREFESAPEAEKDLARLVIAARELRQLVDA